MDAKALNNNFYVFTWSNPCILIAFFGKNQISASNATSIKNAIYQKFVIDGHLTETDANTIHEYITSKFSYDFNENSLACIEFDKNDNIVEPIYGQDIITSYEKNGTELRLYYKSTNKLAISINLKRSNPLKPILYLFFAAVAIALSCIAIMRLLDIEKIKQERADEVIVLKDSLNSTQDSVSRLVSAYDSIKDSNISLKEKANKAEDKARMLQAQNDSLKRINQEREEAGQNRLRQAQIDEQNRIARENAKRNKNKKAEQNRISTQNKEQQFRDFVDRGDRYASSYLRTGSESDRQSAIRNYKEALKIRTDSKISQNIRKLENK